ncbi:hypothetical protein NDU88_003959 [Pleurodeles waltl]|uniref:Uncharacterized protein n=1 Tax=Pleurodeles waltl TaxID=8319 RepID=A0AAV7M8M0_PLEWA|nr:hypothetical protein NDU88_003959 [Pleurodeles waltl]
MDKSPLRLRAETILERVGIQERRAEDAKGRSRSYNIHIVLQHFHNRDSVLREIRKLTETKVDNAQVMFFPGYTIAVQRQRNSFLVVKKQLHELDLKSSLLSLARLRVVVNGTMHFFDSSDNTSCWLQTYGPHATKASQTNTLMNRAQAGGRCWHQPRLSRYPAPRSTPDLDQIITECQRALQYSATLTEGTQHSSPEEELLRSSSDKSSAATWPSHMDSGPLPDVTPQTADNIIQPTTHPF